MIHYMIDENYIKATICLYSFKKGMSVIMLSYETDGRLVNGSSVPELIGVIGILP